MLNYFWDINLGHGITLGGVIISYLALRQNYKVATKAAEQRRSELAKEVDKELEAVTRERHEENKEALYTLKIEIIKLQHLDPCIDEMKNEMEKVRERLHLLEKAIWAIGRSRDRGEM